MEPASQKNHSPLTRVSVPLCQEIPAHIQQPQMRPLEFAEIPRLAPLYVKDTTKFPIKINGYFFLKQPAHIPNVVLQHIARLTVISACRSLPSVHPWNHKRDDRNWPESISALTSTALQWQLQGSSERSLTAHRTSYSNFSSPISPERAPLESQK